MVKSLEQPGSGRSRYAVRLGPQTVERKQSDPATGCHSATPSTPPSWDALVDEVERRTLRQLAAFQFAGQNELREFLNARASEKEPRDILMAFVIRKKMSPDDADRLAQLLAEGDPSIPFIEWWSPQQQGMMHLSAGLAAHEQAAASCGCQFLPVADGGKVAVVVGFNPCALRVLRDRLRTLPDASTSSAPFVSAIWRSFAQQQEAIPPPAASRIAILHSNGRTAEQ